MFRRGLSLIEVMISLTICAMLLTAVAAAFTASSEVIENNDEFFRASQTARVALNQILSDIRQCDAVSFVNSKEVITLTMAADGVTVKHDNDYVYTYDSKSKTGTLRLIDKSSANSSYPMYVLASRVTSLNFAVDTFTDQNGIIHTSRVTVTIAVDQGGNRIYLSGSAALRRVQSYN
jgi:prepilin-type N-terminal cleavage/methylation domain-containing protein